MNVGRFFRILFHHSRTSDSTWRTAGMTANEISSAAERIHDHRMMFTVNIWCKYDHLFTDLNEKIILKRNRILVRKHKDDT